MEGRLALTVAGKEVERHLGLKMNPTDQKKYFPEPLYNIAASGFLPVVTNMQSDKIRFLKWGLIPSWTNSSKNTKGLASIGQLSFKDKPVLQQALTSKRCVVLSTGFYLWKDSPAGKIPYYITLKSKSIFGIAGLWESWEEDGNAIDTGCIITQKTSALLSYFPSEIPLVLKEEKRTAWLESGNNKLLDENNFVPEGEFEYYPVNRKIIKSLDNDPKFIQKITYMVAEQTSMF
jgi:putative SOS response-associated peptidase YedK